MIFRQYTKWFYAVGGSGVVLGLFNYFQSEKNVVKMAQTNNFQPSVKWNYNWDNRQYMMSSKNEENNPSILNQEEVDGLKKQSKPTARKHYIFIRHGQYDTFARTDAMSKLTEKGRQQADKVGQRLKDYKFNYTRLVRSTMMRAQETADIIQKYLPDVPVENCNLIREGGPIRPDPPSNFFADVTDEEFAKDRKRIDSAFQKYFHRADPSQTSDSYEIFVCHSNVIRYIICRLLQFPTEGWLRFDLRHCSMTWAIVLPSGNVVVAAIGDSGYLPKELNTS